MWVYILKSEKTGRYYIGQTANVSLRIKWHNQGLSRSTKTGRPWKIIYAVKCLNRTEAIKKERLIKSYKGGNAFKRLIGDVA